MFFLCLSVGIGGAAGAMLRFWISRRPFPAWCGGWPCATLSVNLIGCALMGALCAYMAYAPGAISPARRALLQAGFLGGLTTFSSFILDAHLLTAAEPAAWVRAALYMAASVFGGWALFAVSYAGVRHVFTA